MLDNLIQGIAKALRQYPVEERRQHIRRPSRYCVYILERKKSSEATVYDISPGGLRFLTTKKFRPGQKIELIFRGVPGGRLTRIPKKTLDKVENKLPCKVVWCVKGTDSYEVGVAFTPENGDLGTTWAKTVLDKLVSEVGPFEEQRRLIRARASLEADLRADGGESVRGVLTNISMGGALFQAQKHLNPGQNVQLSCRSHPKLPPLRVSGHLFHHQFDVVSNSGVHCIKFDKLDDITKGDVKRYVLMLLKTQGSL